MSLSDIDHTWGDDIQVSNTGDLNLVTGTARGQQRILRRLLTNRGGYIFEGDYGAGVLQSIGSTDSPDAVVSNVQAQVLLEDSVAPTPPPTATLLVPPTGYGGNAISMEVEYTDQPSNAPTVLAFVASS